MDFFTSQDVARRKTGKLVVLFVLAVICIIAMVYGVAVIVHQAGHNKVNADGPRPSWWNPQLLLVVGVGVSMVVMLASLYKISQLNGGGHVVAEMLGGARLDPNTATGSERKLLNVVEEMAIASGTPVPPVYLIDETGINAFAAGYTTEDAVIGVTKGAVQTLNRDELQGVIAHEFSHILNGDMKLNIRLMGVIFGILILTVIGTHMLRIGFYSGSSRKKEGTVPIALIGLALLIIGYVGAFFGNLIKAAVSRQREYLADASAVQFTRNPAGISGALKKIGGWSKHSELDHPETAEVSHLLFGAGVTSGFSSMFATHPPLGDRIQRIDPSFNGKFTETRRLSGAEAAGEMAAGFAGAARTAEPAPKPAAVESAVERIGQPSAQHLDYAASLIRSLPPRIIENVREPFGARAVIYALLINDDAEPRLKQLDRLKQYADQAVYEETRSLLPLMAEVDPSARLPIVDMATPALKALSAGQYGAFCKNIDELIRADEKLDLFEWTLQRILRHHLDPQFKQVPQQKVRYASLRQVAPACSVLLSTLTYIGHSSREEAQHAFDAAKSKVSTVNISLLDVTACGIRAVSGALDELAGVTMREKRRLIEACAACISADHEVTVREAELFRAICDSLGCPMPPILPGQPLTA